MTDSVINLFLLLKRLYLGPIQQAKATFSFSQRYSILKPRKSRVRVDNRNHYADKEFFIFTFLNYYYWVLGWSGFWFTFLNYYYWVLWWSGFWFTFLNYCYWVLGWMIFGRKNWTRVMLGQIVIQYEVQSKSNATDEIKQKLLFVHKNVFLRNFPHIYCRSECTFQWAPTTAGSRRRTGLWSRKAWPPPRSSSSPPGSAWWCTADSFLWITENTLLRTNQAKTVHFESLGLVAV